jgi:hypothetical protein
MHTRVRKLLGTIALVIFVMAYALVVMTIAAAKLPGSSGLVQLVFYVVAGLAWIFPAGVIIYWMSKGDRGAR